MSDTLDQFELASSQIDLQTMFDLVGLCDAVRTDLHDRLRAPNRHYHGVTHLALLWSLHRLLAVDGPSQAQDRTIACAILFHDAIYEAGQPDNEALSAQYWEDCFAATPIPDVSCAWVSQTIRASAGHVTLPVEDWSREWFLGLDLAPLAASQPVYERNTRLIRQEYAAIPDRVWTKGRRTFLTGMLRAPKIYRHPLLHARYEALARVNMIREYDALEPAHV